MRNNPFSPIYKLCNAGNSKAKHDALPSFPRIIDLELASLCNFRCLMCPTGNRSMSRDQGLMPDDVYYHLLEQIAGHDVALRFIRWGEPLMHPKFLEFITAARRQGHLVHVNTNGHYLTPELADRLLDVPIDSIKFSFQGVCRESYREMRNVDFFEGLLERIDMLHAKRGAAPFPYIQVSTTVTYETPEQQQAFLTRIEPICDHANIGATSFDWLDLEAVRLKPEEIELLKRLKGHESLNKSHPECPEVFDKLSVNWDGKVTACCMDSDNLMIIGDLMSEKLEAIWQGERMENYRRMLADMRHDDLPLCRHCWDTHGLSASKEAD